MIKKTSVYCTCISYCGSCSVL